jgi:proton translocating ATP synthase F1 alpha subunit
MLTRAAPCCVTCNGSLGTVISVKDGICVVGGLLAAMAGELVYVINKLNRRVAGMVLQLLFVTTVVILFGADSSVNQGCVVVTTGGLVTVTLDYRLFGKVIDALGEVVLTLAPAFSLMASRRIYGETVTKIKRRVDSKAAGIIARAPVRRPMQTGILSVDSLTPIGCGQRELIIGDRQTGKTTIAIDAIVNQGLHGTLHCIYVAVGQKRSTIAKLAYYLNSIKVMAITVIVATSAADTAALQYLAPFTGCTLGEWLGECGGDALVVYDDLSKQAVAYRQISLLLRRAPTREAYPGDVFFLHARLLERAAN